MFAGRCVLCTVLASSAGIQVGPRPTISGHVVDSARRVPAHVELYVWQANGGGSSGGPVVVAADGSFTTPPLLPVTCVLNVGPGPISPVDPGGEGALAIVELGSANVTGVTLETRRSVLRGKFVMRGDDAAAKWPSSIHVTPLLVAGGVQLSGISEGAPNGEFILRNAFGPRLLRPGYILTPGFRWSFSQVLLDGVDVTDIPTDFSRKPDAKLEVVFTQHAGTVEGLVTSASGQPAAGAWIIELSANPALWQPGLITKFQAGRDGRFSSRIRPARYLLAALPATPYQVQPVLDDPAALAARATAVTVGEGKRVEIQLRLPQ